MVRRRIVRSCLPSAAPSYGPCAACSGPPRALGPAGAVRTAGDVRRACGRRVPRRAGSRHGGRRGRVVGRGRDAAQDVCVTNALHTGHDAAAKRSGRSAPQALQALQSAVDVRMAALAPAAAAAVREETLGMLDAIPVAAAVLLPAPFSRLIGSEMRLRLQQEVFTLLTTSTDATG